LDAFEDLRDPHGICTAFLCLTRVALDRRDQPAAETGLQRALAQEAEVGDTALAPELLLIKAEIQSGSGGGSVALDLFQSALTAARKMHIPEVVWEAALGAARIFHSRKLYAQALACYQESVEAIERTCSRIQDDQLQEAYVQAGGRAAVLSAIDDLTQELHKALTESV